ncbi:MAG: response regulator transcription factor [Alphaproteobacteria bacterium]|nr:response regulator transcription factor [Alphaproteobacteria bacterium]
MRALLVEDDEMIGQALVLAMKDAGISLDWVKTGSDAEMIIESAGYAVALLDLMLPGLSGMDLLKRLRAKQAQLPVIIISAKVGVESRLEGLDEGADDYLVKPFDTRELISRLRAVVRRRAGQASSRLICGEIELDLESHLASFRGASQVLPPKAFSLLHALVETPGKIWSKERLEDRIYGWNQEVASNAVEVLIHYVRKRLGRDIITNVRGVGWKVEIPPP